MPHKWLHRPLQGKEKQARLCESGSMWLGLRSLTIQRAECTNRALARDAVNQQTESRKAKKAGSRFSDQAANSTSLQHRHRLREEAWDWTVMGLEWPAGWTWSQTLGLLLINNGTIVPLLHSLKPTFLLCEIDCENPCLSLRVGATAPPHGEALGNTKAEGRNWRLLWAGGWPRNPGLKEDEWHPPDVNAG